MTPLTKQILQSGLSDRPLSTHQVRRLLGGSDARLHGQVNRALKAGELIKPRRGLYVVNPPYRKQPLHPFVLAQQMSPGSYVSAESALGFHGWIPESVHTVLSMTHGGKSVTYESAQLGKFEFRRMTTHAGRFLEQVTRRELHRQVALIAEPLRALLDLVYLRKLDWRGMDFLTEGLRIDEQQLRDISEWEIASLEAVYKRKREQNFLSELRRALGRD
ncbi:MAG TPA: hypothetical protein ENK26_14670 [Gammaproteobacteria bacterium]|nr:hypothetical protein [Gammaproteobacteria bacterium]